MKIKDLYSLIKQQLKEQTSLKKVIVTKIDEFFDSQKYQ